MHEQKGVTNGFITRCPPLERRGRMIGEIPEGLLRTISRSGWKERGPCDRRAIRPQDNHP